MSPRVDLGWALIFCFIKAFHITLFLDVRPSVSIYILSHFQKHAQISTPLYSTYWNLSISCLHASILRRTNPSVWLGKRTKSWKWTVNLNPKENAWCNGRSGELAKTYHEPRRTNGEYLIVDKFSFLFWTPEIMSVAHNTTNYDGHWLLV